MSSTSASPLSAESLAASADRLLALGRPDEAASQYDLALQLRPDDARVLNNYGIALMRSGRAAEATLCLIVALKRAPAFAEARNNLGSAFFRLQKYPEALQCFDSALRLSPCYGEALLNRALALDELQRHDEAARAYDDLLQLDPLAPFALGRRLHALSRSCQWSHYDEQARAVLQTLRAGHCADTPFPFLAVSDEAGLQLTCARTYASQEAAAPTLERGS